MISLLLFHTMLYDYMYGEVNVCLQIGTSLLDVGGGYVMRECKDANFYKTLLN